MKTKTTLFALLMTALFSVINPFTTKANGNIFDVSFIDFSPVLCQFELTMTSDATFPCTVTFSVVDPDGITVFWKGVPVSERVSILEITGLLPSTAYQIFINSQGGGSWTQGFTTDAATGIDDTKTSAVLKATVSGSNLMLASSPEMLGKKGLIYDYTGKAISGFVIENTIQNIDITGLPKGFYLISTDRLVIRIVIMN
jgi:hypothetical protein